MKVLATSRLVIEKAVVSDSNFFYRLLNSPSWLQYIGDRGIKSEANARKYIEHSIINSYKKYGYGLFKLIAKEQGEPIGICGFIKRDYLESADIGFAILPEYEGNGYIQEAAQALMEYGKTTLKLHPILAITTEGNTRSRNLLSRIGMRATGKVRPKGNETEFLLFSNK